MVNDFAVLWADGKREVLEIKFDTRHLEDQFYQAKLLLAEDAYATMGWRFRVAYKHEFNDPIVRDNIEIAFVSRFTVVTERHRQVASRLLAETGEITLGTLSNALESNPLNGRAVSYAMMALRLIAIDLLKPFGDESVVRLAPIKRDGLPPLRF